MAWAAMSLVRAAVALWVLVPQVLVPQVSAAKELREGRGDSMNVLPNPLPSTFEFINHTYAGHRFEGKHAVVFGGTSGIGFATAAMLVQECAANVVVAGRNAAKGNLAASILGGLSQAHCEQRPGAGDTPKARFMRADVRKRSDIRSVLASFEGPDGTRELHHVVNTAGIGGWIGDLADLPESIALGEHDAMLNNLYGAMFVTAEALRFWKLQGCHSPPCPSVSYVPSLVHVSSEQGMLPCPFCGMYGASKHGIIGITTSTAEAHKGSMRANVVLPGLVDTPLTWNQFRGQKLLSNGSLVVEYNLQTGWQCVVDKQVIDGDCPGGGSGYGCPCEDLRRDDPRVRAGTEPLGLWPLIDPRHVGSVILKLSDPKSTLSGKMFAVESKEMWECSEAGPTPLYGLCPKVPPKTGSKLEHFFL